MSAKSLSWVMRMLFLRLASARTLPFERPFGDDLASWPSSTKKERTRRLTFSSIRNRTETSLQKGGFKFTFFEDSSGVVESGLDMGAGKTGVGLLDLLKRLARLQHVHYEIHHDTRALKAWFSVAKLRIYRDIFLNQAKLFVSQDISHIWTLLRKAYHGTLILSRTFDQSRQ